MGSSNDTTYFDSFGVDHFPKEIKTFIGDKTVLKNDEIIFEYFQ